MTGFLHWMRTIMVAVLNGIAKFAFLLVLIFVVLLVVGLARGDGLPGKMVLALDLRQSISDSAATSVLPLATQPLTVMNIVLGLDAASRDNRIKGAVVRLGDGALSLAQAEEIATAFQRFRARGKFVIAQATGFLGAGMGDYVAAAAANEIWVQPKSDFKVSGAGGAEIFLRGLFDKVHAEPQMVKRVEYKSAADMYMEKNMTDADREQLGAMMQSWYDAAVAAVARARHLDAKAVAADFEAAPQFAEDAKREGLVDRIGFEDDARAAALGRAGTDAKLVTLADYNRTKNYNAGAGANVAVIEASGDIADGTAQGSLLGGTSGITSDDLAATIRQAAGDSTVKAIVLRVDSPGGSVTAADQILDAVKKAQAKGKPVVVSMGDVAASGGYYISTSANKIVAEPATITGSIGVLTGKVSVGKSLDMAGVGFAQVAIGKNTLMDSMFSPYTPDQLTALNHEADVIYDDFLHKVAAGRKLPLAQVQQIARGRVWTGADAKSRGLVDTLGGFWTAADTAARLGGVPADRMVLKAYSRRRSLIAGLSGLMGRTGASLRVLEGLQSLLALPGVGTAIKSLAVAPRGGVELRATNLPLQ